MSATAGTVRAEPRRGAALRLGAFEWGALAALTALALGPLAGLLLRVWIRGGVVTGSDGYLVVDQLQYLNWLRQAAGHVAAANLYDIAPLRHTFVHPGILISGLLHKAGLGVAAAYLIWKPVAIAATFAGALALVRARLARTDDRRLALVVGLFFCSPVAALVGWPVIGGQLTKFRIDFSTGELWSGSYLWGYLFTAIAVGLLPLALLAYERGRDGGSARMIAWAALAGLLSAWLQPWQGATFAIVAIAAELWLVVRGGRRASRAARDLAAPLVATALPLLYYLILSHTDPAWKLAQVANDLPRWPLWVTVVALAPLAVPAAFAYRLAAPDFGSLALRLWPAAGLLIFYAPVGTFPFHAFQGMQLPLAVLAVLAWRAHRGSRALPTWGCVAVVAILVVPGTVYRIDQWADAVRLGRQPHFLTVGERDALRMLAADPERGGVLAPVYSGLFIPAYTGRETWIGAGSWSPDFEARRALTERLFAGAMSPAEARALVRRSGARFLFSDCHGRAPIERLVAGFTDPPLRFGCATVYRVRGARG